jgi:hypothetical protein
VKQGFGALGQPGDRRPQVHTSCAKPSGGVGLAGQGGLLGLLEAAPASSRSAMAWGAAWASWLAAQALIDGRRSLATRRAAHRHLVVVEVRGTQLVLIEGVRDAQHVWALTKSRP